MAQICSFFNANLVNGEYDRKYNAADWAEYFSTFIANGVSPNPASGEGLSIQASSGLTVLMSTGTAFINGYRYQNTSPLTINISPADNTYNRITNIIIELNMGDRNIVCKTVDGTPAPTPVAPALVRNSGIYQLCIAEILVLANCVQLEQNNITDNRSNPQLCGWMRGLFGIDDWGEIQEEINTLSTSVKNIQTDAVNSADVIGINWANIKGGDDFNTYQTNGYYLVFQDSDLMHVANAPVQEAGYLMVLNDNSFVYQRYVTYTNVIYMRNYYSFNNTWSSWVEVATEESAPIFQNAVSFIGQGATGGSSVNFLNASGTANTVFSVNPNGEFNFTNGITNNPLMNYTPVTTNKAADQLIVNCNIGCQGEVDFNPTLVQLNGDNLFDYQNTTQNITYANGNSLGVAINFWDISLEGLLNSQSGIGLLNITLTPNATYEWSGNLNLGLEIFDPVIWYNIFTLQSGIFGANFNSTTSALEITSNTGKIQLVENQSYSATFLITA